MNRLFFRLHGHYLKGFLLGAPVFKLISLAVLTRCLFGPNAKILGTDLTVRKIAQPGLIPPGGAAPAEVHKEAGYLVDP